MPRISATSNAAQRAETQRRILTGFGELLFTHGLPGLTMTDVARHARIGRTAVYNYYADIEELLIAYALDETERFLVDLKQSLDSWRTRWTAWPATSAPRSRTSAGATCHPDPQWPQCSRRRRSPNSPATSGSSASCCRASCGHGMAQGYLPDADVIQLAQLIHGTLSSSAARGDGASGDAEAEARLARTVRFIQLGAGARFDGEGRPVRRIA